MALPEIRAVVTADTKQAEAGFSRVEAGLGQMSRASDRANARVGRLAGGMVRTGNRGAGLQNQFRNLGFQINDFAVQVGAGTRASVALGQQLPQLLQGFGGLGIALSVIAAVGIPVVSALRGMNTEGESMLRIFGTLEPVVRSIGDVFGSVGQIAVSFAEVVINNLDRILITAGTVAAFMAGKWVVGFVAARIATFSLVGALTAFRAALIRTGIGALIIAAGELVFQFSRLVNAAGGFGAALGLLRDIGIEALSAIGQDGGRILELGMMAAFSAIEAGFLEMIARMQEALASFFEKIRSGIQGIPGLGDVADTLGTAAIDLRSGAGATRGAPDAEVFQPGTAEGARERAESFGSQAAGLARSSIEENIPSLERMREILAAMKDEKITLPDILGTAVDEEGGGGKKKDATTARLEEQTAALEGLREAGRNTYSALGDFVQQFAGKSKAAAVAAIAIQKGLSIAQIIANTAAAQMRALAELGPIAGPPVAAKIGLYGKAQAALVAATGLAQAAGAGSAGGASGGGLGPGGDGRGLVNTQRVDINIIGGNDRDRLVAAEVINVLNNSQRDGFRLDPRLIGA